MLVATHNDWTYGSSFTLSYLIDPFDINNTIDTIMKGADGEESTHTIIPGCAASYDKIDNESIIGDYSANICGEMIYYGYNSRFGGGWGGYEYLKLDLLKPDDCPDPSYAFVVSTFSCVLYDLVLELTNPDDQIRSIDFYLDDCSDYLEQLTRNCIRHRQFYTIFLSLQRAAKNRCVGSTWNINLIKFLGVPNGPGRFSKNGWGEDA